MKKSKLFRTLTLAVAAALCMATTTVTAYAGGADPDPVPLPETTEAPAEVPEETEEPTTGGMEPEGVPVTPQGKVTPREMVAIEKALSVSLAMEQLKKRSPKHKAKRAKE